VAAGDILPVAAEFVKATGTAADTIIALW